MVISLSKLKNNFKRKKKRYIITICVFFVLLVVYIMFSIIVNPVIVNTIELRVKSISTRAMNSAIADVVMGSVIYDDLINIVTDELGNISMIQANSLEINNLTKNLAQATENKIEQYGKNGVSIAVGSFTGIPLFVGMGPNVNLKATPIGAVSCSFVSKFESAGINQTIHRIYVDVTANVGVVLPLVTKKFITKQQLLVSESIIVGSVPEVYLHSDDLSTLLNFVPY